MPVAQTPVWKLILPPNSADQTTALGTAMAPHLGPGDVILLEGPIGAGKSHFARAVIRARLRTDGLVEDIPSPTFTLVQTYQAGALEIWHSDLYRLSDLNEVAELGLLDAFQSALCLVEWPDRLAVEAPDSALTIRFDLADDPDKRILHFSAGSARWDWLKPLLGAIIDD